MIRFSKIFIRFSALAILVSFAACTSKSSTPVTISSATDPYSLDSSSSTNANLFGSATSNANLFGSTTVNDVPAAVPTSYPALTTQSQVCLSGSTATNPYGYYPPASTTSNPYATTSGSSLPPWYQTTNTSTLSGACLDPNSNSNYTTTSLLNMGLQSFGAMQDCYSLVMQQGPQICSTQAPDQAFQMASMALVRCFRGILQRQQQLVQWEPQQQQIYQNTDSYLYQMLGQLPQLSNNY